MAALAADKNHSGKAPRRLRCLSPGSKGSRGGGGRLLRRGPGRRRVGDSISRADLRRRSSRNRPPPSRSLRGRNCSRTVSMDKFPVDAPKQRVVGALTALGFRVVREKEHISMTRGFSKTSCSKTSATHSGPSRFHRCFAPTSCVTESSCGIYQVAQGRAVAPTSSPRRRRRGTPRCRLCPSAGTSAKPRTQRRPCAYCARSRPRR